MTRLTAVLGVALALAIPAPAPAAFGQRDCTFGNGGTQIVSGAFGPMFDAVGEPGGTSLVRLGFLSTGSNLYRIDANGTTSTSIGSNANAGLADPLDVLLTDGRILFTTGCGATNCQGSSPPAGGAPPGVGRLLAAGGLDPAFGTGGYAKLAGFNVAISAPVVQSDGKIVAGGLYNGGAALVRFNADGTIDTTFGTGGVATNPGTGTNGYISIAAQPDGRIVAVTSHALYRHGTDGQLDATFGVSGVASVATFFAAQVRVQPSGKILVAGNTPAGPLRLARYTVDGAVDASVGGGLGFRDVAGPTGPLVAGYSPYLPLSMMADGRPVMSGAAGSGPGSIVRYGVDLTDDVAAALEFPQPSGAFVLPDGKVLVGQSQTQTGYVRRLLGDADVSTCVTSTTSLTSYPSPSSYGQSVLLIATVTLSNGGTPQGSVEFRRGTASLGTSSQINNGVATLDVSLPEGDSALTAIFTGNGSIVGSTSPVYTHTVTPRTPTTTTLTSSPNPSTPGQTVTLTATVAPQSGPGTPVGTVQFKDGGSFMGSPVALSSGIATLATTALGDGTHSLTAQYSGDASFASSTSAPVSHVVPGRLTITDPSVNAAAAAVTMNFQVTLTSPSASTVTVNYATSDHTAIAGTHYTAVTGMLTFTPGQTSKNIPVPIAQSQPGPSRDFFLTLSGAVNASIAKGAGIGTINYADSATLALYVNDPSVAEGPPGVTLMGFNVSLSRTFGGTLQVNYATANGSAVAGTDYAAQAGTLSFPPGVTQRWVMVPIVGNTQVQSNRTLFLNLSSPSTGTLAKGQGTGTIVDDDPAPAASSIAMLRLYSDVTKEHLYTTDSNEYAILGTRGWVQEGTAYTMFSNAGTYGPQYAIPLYRLYHGGIQQHHWTTDYNEVMGLASIGSWAYEGIAGYVLPAAGAGSTPLYRLRYPFNPIHLWTIDAYEKDVLSTQYGWVYEGVVGEVLP